MWFRLYFMWIEYLVIFGFWVYCWFIVMCVIVFGWVIWGVDVCVWCMCKGIVLWLRGWFCGVRFVGYGFGDIVIFLVWWCRIGWVWLVVFVFICLGLGWLSWIVFVMVVCRYRVVVVLCRWWLLVRFGGCWIGFCGWVLNCRYVGCWVGRIFCILLCCLLLWFVCFLVWCYVLVFRGIGLGCLLLLVVRLVVFVRWRIVIIGVLLVDVVDVVLGCVWLDWRLVLGLGCWRWLCWFRGFVLVLLVGLIGIGLWWLWLVFCYCWLVVWRGWIFLGCCRLFFFCVWYWWWWWNCCWWGLFWLFFWLFWCFCCLLLCWCWCVLVLVYCWFCCWLLLLFCCWFVGFVLGVVCV